MQGLARSLAWKCTLALLAVFAALLVAWLVDAILLSRPPTATASHPASHPAGSVGRFTVQLEPGPRTVLVLDLDETLVRTLPDLSRTFDRPHVHEFLRRAARMFDELVLFTAGTRDYARPVADRLEAESGVPIRRRFYRDSCTLLVGADGAPAGYAKDLRRVWPDLERVLLLDNTPAAYSLQPACGVPIESFYGDPSDDALLDALPALAERRLDMGVPAS